MKNNPVYKGKWNAPYIDNPAYNGPWAPRKIKNPEFYEDKHPANFEAMGAIGFEIWTMQNDILFDNIYVGHSIADAEKLAEETFKLKHPVEKALADADKPKSEDTPKSPSDLKFSDDPVNYIEEKLDLLLTIVKNDPIEAIKLVFDAAGGIATVIVALIAVLVGLVGLRSASPATQKAAKDAKDRANGVKDKAVSGAATGAEKAKGEAAKRRTFSQSQAAS